MQLRRHWGGGIMGQKSMARIAKLERAKAKEQAQKSGWIHFIVWSHCLSRDIEQWQCLIIVGASVSVDDDANADTNLLLCFINNVFINVKFEVLLATENE